MIPLCFQTMTTDGCTTSIEIHDLEIVRPGEHGEETELDTPLIEAFPAAQRTEDHAFGHSLLPYIANKIPVTKIPQRPSRIVIKPCHPGDQLPLSSGTKTDKIPNRQQPHFRYVQSTNTLEILCDPGKDIINHYALLAATYYGLLSSRDPVQTLYHLPSQHQCFSWLLSSNLRELGRVDTVVLGYVERLSRTASKPWCSGDLTEDSVRKLSKDRTHKLFAWQIYHASGANKDAGRDRIAFLGCLFNLWGDLAASLVDALHLWCNVRQILYVGKAGSLRDEDEPNMVIVTGNHSWIDDTQIMWDNVLQEVLSHGCPPQIQTGSNVSVASPLQETSDWLSTWRKRCQWVDCEVSHFALACREHHIPFGYLSIISDNVVKWHKHDLTNERLQIVGERRQALFGIIESIIDRHLNLLPAEKPATNANGQHGPFASSVLTLRPSDFPSSAECPSSTPGS